MPTIKGWRERAATARRLAGSLNRQDTELLQYYAAECEYRADCLATGACGKRCALCPLTGERCDEEAP
jgi:hypothetical protein